jgi:hypothetical protein
MRCSEPLRTSRPLLPPPLSAHHAGAAPHYAVAELGVVRRCYAHSNLQNQNIMKPIIVVAITAVFAANLFAQTAAPKIPTKAYSPIYVFIIRVISSDICSGETCFGLFFLSHPNIERALSLGRF